MITQEQFDSVRSLPGWPQSQRQQAWQTWQTMTLPTTRDEAWKYTSLTRLEKLLFTQPSTSSSKLTLKDIPFTLSQDHFSFINGTFEAALSSQLTDNTYLLSKRAWPAIATAPISYFERLNAALLTDGLYLDIKENTNAPIYLLLLGNDTDTLINYHLRHHIKVHSGIKSELVIIDWSFSDTSQLTTNIIDIDLAENAELNCIHIKRTATQGYHIQHTAAHLAKNSRFHHFNIDFGAKLSRNEVSTVLHGHHAECQLHGLALAKGIDRIDNQTKIAHLAAETHSEEQYRGIVDNKACHIFHGHVLVDKQAPDSIANQQNKNILLTSTAEVYTEPQLEIYNQNVQCIHGATVGDLDAEALFYLRSRGLSEEKARQLLIFGFARNVLETIPDKTLQTELAQWIKTHLALDSELTLDLYKEDDHEHANPATL